MTYASGSTTVKENSRVDEEQCKFGVSSPIKLNASSVVIEIFLNLVNVSIPTLTKIELVQGIKLLDLMNELDCSTKLIGLVTSEITKQIDKEGPWNVLVYASKIDNIKLAKEALINMGDINFLQVNKTKSEDEDKKIDTLRFWDRMKLLSDHW
ncbi:uncharacterized protein L201_000812 [Kwoniella dendrophila CBS 6074]|uniref:Uncharacterized protein n=1 Tax=Kwoniella dendrophila CBS 6074 TaxID=1295534 RepID=A0AAX4JKL2_9TREE